MAVELDANGNPIFKKATQTPPEPPRLAADWAVDMPSMRDWMAEFYVITVVQSGLLDPVYQQVVGEISFENLPDPELTTVARAQATANAAWEAAESFKRYMLDSVFKRYVFGGQFTIANTDASANIAFPLDVGSTDYTVTVTPTGATGAPSVDAFRIIAVTKGTGGIGVSVTGAPGPGNSVTYDYQVIGKVPEPATT